MAFPTPAGDTAKPLVPTSVRSSRQDLPWDKSLGSPDGAAIHLDPNIEGTWVEATFAAEVTLRSVEFPSIQKFNHGWSYEPGVKVKIEAVLASGLNPVADYDMPQSSWTDDQPMTLACKEVAARTYRITIVNKHPMDFPYLRLFSAGRKHNWESEAGWTLRSLDRSPYPLQSKPAWLDQSRLVDLTGKLDAAGILHWKAPAGHWTLLRWGHVNTGAKNGPAPPAGIGWECNKFADLPMCEFWQPRMENFVGSFNFKPIKPCVSAARMYGKRRIGAEAFTSFNLTWAEHPGMLKAIANMHFAEGITHLFLHAYTHYPRSDALPPGTSLGSIGVGTPFDRGQTWWKHMPEFTGYLARCGYLLEHGNPVSDVLWYLGDELDHKPLETAPFPAGYRFDYCNPDALLHRITLSDGRWVTPEGISYRVLWLPDCPRMLPETLEHILALVQQGATLSAPLPNQLSVEVTNTWRNRLAYDSARPEAQRKTWVMSGPSPVPLIPAGLLGPVNLRVGQIVTVP